MHYILVALSGCGSEQAIQNWSAASNNHVKVLLGPASAIHSNDTLSPGLATRAEGSIWTKPSGDTTVLVEYSNSKHGFKA